MTTDALTGEAAVTFLQESGSMKRLPRVGWLQRGVTPAESLADHSYRVTLFAMLIADAIAQETPVDTERVLRMALVHDLAETRFGDLPSPAKRYLPENAKANAEALAFKDMTVNLGAIGQHYQALRNEESAAETLESRIVNAADRLELLLQAVEYELAGNRRVAEFWQSSKNETLGDLHPIVKEMLTAIERRRPTP